MSIQFEPEQQVAELTFSSEPEGHVSSHQVQDSHDQELVASTETNAPTLGESLNTRDITIENLLNSDAPSNKVPPTLNVLAKSAPKGIRGFWRTLINCILHLTSWSQTKLELAVKTALKKDESDSHIGEISHFMAENIDWLDPKIIAAYTEALKGTQAAEDFRNQVEAYAREKLSSSSMVHDSIVTTATNASYVTDALSDKDTSTSNACGLPSLVQKIHTENPAMTLVPLATFMDRCPEDAQRLASKNNISYMAQTATDVTNGMVLACMDPNFKLEILNLIDEGLFEGAQDRARNIENFLKNDAVTANLFYTDGIQRYEIPHIVLPNGVEILTNYAENNEFCRSKFCKTIDANGNKKYDQAEYLAYMLDRFEEAYGKEDAIRAFKVFVQNFIGSGNTLGSILLAIHGVHPTLAPWLGTMVPHEMRQGMGMDKDFNITMNMTRIMRTKAETIEKLHSNMKKAGYDIPEITENSTLAVTINSTIPAKHNNTMNQGKDGEQQTDWALILSP
jgi:hypothetical protein